MPAGRVAPRAGRWRGRSRREGPAGFLYHPGYAPGWGQNLRVVRFDSAPVPLPVTTPLEMTASPRAVEAMARVFGPGCTNLDRLQRIRSINRCTALVRNLNERRSARASTQ